jgi:hypothetical protein
MINKGEKTKLSKYLKNVFIADVLRVLEDWGIKNSEGETFSKSYISHVYNGREEHEHVEKALFVVYQQRKEKHTKTLSFRNQILKEEQLEQ